MATLKQKMAVAKILENPSQSISSVMREVGYSPNTAIVPGDLTNSKGFQELLDEAGLTDSYLNSCLHEDIEAKKGNRKGELELAYKLKKRIGEDAQDKPTVPVTLNITFVSNQFARGV